MTAPSALCCQSEPHNLMLQLLRTGILTITWLIVAACLLLLFSASVPVIPVVRIYAFDFVPNHVTWLVVMALVTLAIGIFTHKRRATWATRNLIAAAAIAALLSSGMMAHLLYVALSNGARIDLIKTLSIREYSEAAAPDETQLYSSPGGERLWLDIYRPQRGKGGALSPVLFVAHGGGFVEGSRSIGAANMRSYADRGWTVISIDYRLARSDRPTWDLAVSDVRCALAWTAANADALGIDITRLTLSGGSAGGSLVMAAAYSSGGEQYDTRCGSHIPRVAAVITKAPLIDVIGSWQHPGELREVQRHYLQQYIGGAPDRYPDRYAAVDLRRYAATKNPPTLILAGAQDPLLPAAATIDFARNATAAGNQVRLVVFPYSGHDFNTAFGSITNQAAIQIVAQFMTDHDLGPKPARP